MIKSNKPIQTEEYITLTKWDPLKSKKGKEETNTNYRVNKESKKLERRPMRKGRPR
jgi:hypothetical protein